MKNNKINSPKQSHAKTETDTYTENQQHDQLQQQNNISNYERAWEDDRL